MIMLLIASALAADEVGCAHIRACQHERTFACPPGAKWKHTPHGCFDGRRFYAYKYTIKRTSLDVVGYKARKK